MTARSSVTEAVHDRFFTIDGRNAETPTAYPHGGDASRQIALGCKGGSLRHGRPAPTQPGRTDSSKPATRPNRCPANRTRGKRPVANSPDRPQPVVHLNQSAVFRTAGPVSNIPRRSARVSRPELTFGCRRWAVVRLPKPTSGSPKQSFSVNPRAERLIACIHFTGRPHVAGGP
jgi:hypothetical protein